jgi:hypothetical protein
LKLGHWKLIRKISAIYILVVAILFTVDIAILNIVDYGGKPANFIGCYAYDAMLVGFDCSGFIGAKQVSLALNFPLFHLYVPFFVLFKPIMIFVVVALWFFPIMFVLSIIVLRRKST